MNRAHAALADLMDVGQFVTMDLARSGSRPSVQPDRYGTVTIDDLPPLWPRRAGCKRITGPLFRAPQRRSDRRCAWNCKRAGHEEIAPSCLRGVR
jgi:hypothetical protein